MSKEGTITKDYRRSFIDHLLEFTIPLTLIINPLIQEWKPPADFLECIGQLSQFLTSFNIYSEQPILFNALFLLATYFWAIVQWIVYHRLVEDNPYNWKKFSIDVVLYSTIFIILCITLLAYKYEVALFTFISLLIIWHGFAYLWHRPNRSELEQFHKDKSSVTKNCRHHIWCMVIYAALLGAFLLHATIQKYEQEFLVYNIISIGVITALLVINLKRLNDLMHIINIDKALHLVEIKGYIQNSSMAICRAIFFRLEI
jgi:hypothetical protein